MQLRKHGGLSEWDRRSELRSCLAWFRYHSFIMQGKFGLYIQRQRLSNWMCTSWWVALEKTEVFHFPVDSFFPFYSNFFLSYYGYNLWLFVAPHVYSLFSVLVLFIFVCLIIKFWISLFWKFHYFFDKGHFFFCIKREFFFEKQILD